MSIQLFCPTRGGDKAIKKAMKDNENWGGLYHYMKNAGNASKSQIEQFVAASEAITNGLTTAKAENRTTRDKWKVNDYTVPKHILPDAYHYNE